MRVLAVVDTMGAGKGRANLIGILALYVEVRSNGQHRFPVYSSKRQDRFLSNTLQHSLSCTIDRRQGLCTGDLRLVMSPSTRGEAVHVRLFAVKPTHPPYSTFRIYIGDVFDVSK